MKDFTDRTISGFNEFIQSSPKNAELSLLLFSDTVNIVYQNVQIENVKPLTLKAYKPNGFTALLDGIGKAIELAKKYQPTSWADDDKDVTILIMTDGQENSSKEYTKSQINASISRQKLFGWKFIFMGANQDAIQTASEFSIDQESSLTFGCENVGEAFQCASQAIKRSANGDNIEFTQLERITSLQV
jgi:uncharacterized protein YegL